MSPHPPTVARPPTPGLGLLVSRIYSEGISDGDYIVLGSWSFARNLSRRERRRGGMFDGGGG